MSHLETRLCHIGWLTPLGQNEQKWATEKECDLEGNSYYARSLYGRTVGMLGYGALGRETARLLKAHGMRVIAANTSGKATTQDGVGTRPHLTV